MSEKSHFKVVIVGGSIAGLALAHCLDANGIDYVVLERREDIAPQVGASVSLMPNGSRILDQLGLFNEVSQNIEPCIFMQTWTGEGKLLSETNAPILTSKRLGYTITFLERERLLKILYDRLPDKTKVLVSKDVKYIEQDEKHAVVYCKDGSKYEGDVIAGADGIRSSIRAEMRRCISQEGNPEDLEALKRDETSLSVQYSCLFGISKPTKRLEIGHTHRSSTQGASTLLFGGEKGRVYWFLFTENSERTYGSDVPRYNKDEEISHVAKFMDHQVSGDVTFSDVWKNRIVSNFVPVEEMVNEHWVWNRIACLGDSVHKMTPNLGQGANCAIESAAELANSLARIKASTKASPSFTEVTQALKSYHKKRHVRANQIVHAANKFTRVEALATRGDFIASMYIMPRLGDILADRGAKVQIGAAKLDALPMPKRALEGTMSWSENAGIGKEEDRGLRKKLAAPLLILAVVFWWMSRAARKQAGIIVDEMITSSIVPGADFALVEWFSDWAPLDRILTRGGANFILGWGYDIEQRLEVLKSFSYSLSIVVIWTIESFRRGNVLSVANIFPNILFLIAQFKGLGIIAPLYFFLHYIQSPQENYAALDNRLTNTAFAQTAVLTFLIVLIGPAAVIFSKTSAFEVQWQYACFGFLYPIALAVVPRVLMKCLKDTTPTDRLYKPTADLPYLRFTYVFCAALCAGCYTYTSYFSQYSFLELVVSKTNHILHLLTSGPTTYSELSDFTTLTAFAAAFYWIVLSFADLKAAGRSKLSWLVVVLALATLTTVAGPGAAILLMWAWREDAMAKKMTFDFGDEVGWWAWIETWIYEHQVHGFGNPWYQHVA